MCLRLIVLVLTLFCASCGSTSPGSPTNPTPTPPAPGPISLSAPTHVTPADDQQLNTLQPALVISNATASQPGIRVYEFEVSTNADFSAVVVRGQNVREDASGRTSWVPPSALQSTTRFSWRARAIQDGTVGPWSTATRFRSRIEGFNRPGELFDPLVNGATVGAPVNVTLLPEQGVRLDSLGSRIVYRLAQPLAAGEFSLLATGLTTHSDGDSTKLFAMQDGFTDLTTNPYRATIEKRDHGTVTFRFIAGDSDTRADGDRIDLEFNPSLVYFWKFTWGSGIARLQVLEDGEQGRPVYDRSETYGGTYRPSQHVAYVGAPPGRAGINTASVPGAIVRYVWLAGRPRPAGLGSMESQD